MLPKEPQRSSLQHMAVAQKWVPKKSIGKRKKSTKTCGFQGMSFGPMAIYTSISKDTHTSGTTQSSTNDFAGRSARHFFGQGQVRGGSMLKTTFNKTLLPKVIAFLAKFLHVAVLVGFQIKLRNTKLDTLRGG